MAEITCSRCARRTEGLLAAPLPGAPGQSVLRGTCPSCWSEWLAWQVKLINEHKLSPAKPEHYQRLIEEMRGFLSLAERD